MKKASGPHMRVAGYIFAGLAAIFLLLFLGRLVHNLTTRGDSPRGYGGAGFDVLGEMWNLTGKTEPKNIAGSPDRKYEHIAKLSVRSMQYEADLAKARAVIAEYSGQTQREESGGLPGERKAEIKIGVPPDAFEALQNALSKLGQVTAANVTFKDMTQEYNRLLDEEESLAQHLESPEARQARQAQIDDPEGLLTNAWATMLQNVRARLDDYSGDRSLCTVEFTLYEGSLVNLGKEAGEALSWSAGYFSLGMGVALLAALLSLAVAALWNRVKHPGQKTGEQ